MRSLSRIFIVGLICSVALVLLRTGEAQIGSVSINIDASANRHPINPLIYGVNFASASELSDLNCPLNRQGGNTTTRYNWKLNADNRGADWYFQSIAYSNTMQGGEGDDFISRTRASGAEPMLTIPMAGWVAKVGANRSKLASFSIAKYGAQTDKDWQWFPDAGNGIWTNGQYVTGNDPNDANVPADSSFQQGWITHLISKWGTADKGGLRYYIMDNEPSIWHSTHRDVHPTGTTMEEVRDKILDYAAKVKTADPNAIVVGPEEWGWSGYLFSGYDLQYGSKYGWSNLPDRSSHGGWDYMPWLLDQLNKNNISTNRRLLDVFSVHYYPQGGEYSNDTSNSMQLRRNRSTRSLWDPNYVDETWINDKVQLIPRIKRWVNTYYPNTQTAITEYNWGAEDHINGATTQADILGIFGREGLDIANRWTTPNSSTPTYKAMKMYRNYDGKKSTFGDTSVLANTPNPDNLSAFAAIRSNDGTLTVMVINKALSGSINASINISNFQHAATAQVWQLTASNSITRLADVSFNENSLNVALPQQSITLFVISPSTTPTPTPTPVPVSTPTPTPIPSPTSGSVYQINCGGGITGTFKTDTYFNGGTVVNRGNIAIKTVGVVNVAPVTVYQTERYGNFNYTFPNLVPGRRYLVRLHFAETYWRSAGKRLFNVTINGSTVLTNFDVYKTARTRNKAVVKEFTSTANSSGKIELVYTTVLNNAISNGIEIINK
jgi:hypothetical protein